MNGAFIAVRPDSLIETVPRRKPPCKQDKRIHGESALDEMIHSSPPVWSHIGRELS
jgi:hypothetical protein